MKRLRSRDPSKKSKTLFDGTPVAIDHRQRSNLQMQKLSLVLLVAGTLGAQAPNAPTGPIGNESQPIFRVTVVERTTNAVSYRHRSGWTKVDLHGTPLAPDAIGHADVNSRPGYIEAKAEMHKLLPASQ